MGVSTLPHFRDPRARSSERKIKHALQTYKIPIDALNRRELQPTVSMMLRFSHGGAYRTTLHRPLNSLGVSNFARNKSAGAYLQNCGIKPAS